MEHLSGRLWTEPNVSIGCYGLLDKNTLAYLLIFNQQEKGFVVMTTRRVEEKSPTGARTFFQLTLGSK
jgi:hypothetical protein